MSKAQELADKLTAGIVTGSDWPNTDDEVLRLNAAAELRRLDRVNAAAGKLASEVDALRAFEMDVRAVIGNTNWDCLMGRLAALSSSGGNEL